MGEIKQVLSSQHLDNPLFPDSMRFESCEHIHFHWRDMRIVMTYDQLLLLARDAAASMLDLSLYPNKQPPHDDSLLIHSQIQEPYLFQGEGKVEECADGQTIHLHLGDIRFEWTPTMFFMVADMMRKAFDKYFLRMIPLKDINPYDHVHFPTYEEWVSVLGADPVERMKDWWIHQGGIKQLEYLIAYCKSVIPPIIVTRRDGHPCYQRRDGFKRYMAYQNLGHCSIPCYVVSEEIAMKMPQHVDKEDQKL